MLKGRRGFLLGIGALLSAAQLPVLSRDQRRKDGPDALYDALRTQPQEILEIAGSRIELVFDQGAPGLNRRLVRGWVEAGARAVSTYFGRYPTRNHGLLIVAQDGDRVGRATTYGYDGSLTQIHVGTGATDIVFSRDWVLVHEMVHTALPELPRRALWLEEGSATWLEPIARAQAGQLAASEVWRQAIEGMPQGTRDASAGGMNGTREWGRLYWGGATFWLLAEIAVYEGSRGRAMLRDALRAINRHSGGNIAEWTPEQMMAAGDAATGTSQLQPLYERFASRPSDIDLGATFRRLGVSVDSTGAVRFDNSAPLAVLAQRINLR
jgi:hypothetical protein